MSRRRMMTVRLTEHLQRRASDTWSGILAHPCIRSIADGTLPSEHYAYYLKQDYQYLEDYAKALDFAAAKAPEAGLAAAFSSRMVTSLERERAFVIDLGRMVGLTPADMENEAKQPTVQGYTDHLVRTAALGTFEESLTALLVCNWCFFEIGQVLAASVCPPESVGERLAEAYSAPGVEDVVVWCRGVIDAWGVAASSASVARLESVFLVSSRYERRFWDAVHSLERWS
jgi:thiaminase/transcriptional activator TenA